MKIKPLLGGCISYIPLINKFVLKSGGGTDSARYCYSVWLRHLVMAYKKGLSVHPKVVAELGPGNSLGAGLAAIISGVDVYYALDVAQYTNLKKNIEIFDELVSLFRNREKIPDENYKPYLESHEFPSYILTEERLKESLSQSRIASIRKNLLDLCEGNKENSQIFYFIPWFDPEVIKKESVDMIFSQAVLEHIDDLALTYESFYYWLKPNGFMSHQIDFRCHEKAKEWNGHWACSDFAWKLMKGKRPFLLNRQPHSTHIDLLHKFNFEIVCDTTINHNSGIQRKQLAPRFSNISEDDLTTQGVFIQAVKKNIEWGKR
jgi:hypothetical protein